MRGILITGDVFKFRVVTWHRINPLLKIILCSKLPVCISTLTALLQTRKPLIYCNIMILAFCSTPIRGKTYLWWELFIWTKVTQKPGVKISLLAWTKKTTPHLLSCACWWKNKHAKSCKKMLLKVLYPVYIKLLIHKSLHITHRHKQRSLSVDVLATWWRRRGRRRVRGKEGGGAEEESRDEACEDWETSWLMVLSQPKFKAKCEAAEVSHSLWVFDHVTV